MYNYSLVVDRKSYILPAKNLHLVEDMERVSRIDSVRGMSLREKYEEILKFIISVIGESNAKEVLGSTVVDEVDLSAVAVTFRMIVDAYNKPLSDYNARKSNEAFSNIPSDKIDKIIKMAEAARDVSDD
jgi:hypothetical protein